MLYYIHGYQSTPNSAKGAVLKESLNARLIEYRDCKPEDLVISTCLRRIAEEIQNDTDVTLIGSSLGGFLATETALQHANVKRLVLLNPAIIPPTEDISKLQGIPERILHEMSDDRLFEEKIDAEIMMIVGTEDNIVPLSWTLRFAMAQEATIRFLHDDHSLTHNLSRLPHIIREMLSIDQ